MKALIHAAIRFAFLQGYKAGMKRAEREALVADLRFGAEEAHAHADEATAKLWEQV